MANGSYWKSWLRQSSSGRLDPYTRGTAAYLQLHSLSPSSVQSFFQLGRALIRAAY